MTDDLHHLTPSRGGLTATAVAYEAGRRSARPPAVWPWRAATGLLAAGLAVAVLQPRGGVADAPEPAVAVADTPPAAPLPPHSALALRRAVLNGDPLPPPGGGRATSVPRAGPARQL